MTRRSWVIDVCLTCDRLAVYPFCEHRPKGYVPDAPPWCGPVPVYTNAKRKAPS